MNRIKELRKSNNVSQEKLAKALNVHQTAVSQWEQGRTRPDNQLLSDIALYFGVSIDYLLGYDIGEKEFDTIRNKISEIYSLQKNELKNIEKYLEVDLTIFENWIEGKNNYFNTLDGLTKLSKAFNISINYMLGIYVESPDTKQMREVVHKWIIDNNELSIQSICAKTRVNYQTLREWSKGYGDFFNDKVSLLSELMDCSIDYLYGRTKVHFSISNDSYYNSLNDSGKERVNEYIKDLAGNSQYSDSDKPATGINNITPYKTAAFGGTENEEKRPPIEEKTT